MFKTRILTALGLLILCLPVVFFAPVWGFAVLCAGVMVIAAREWGLLSGLRAQGALLYAAAVAVGLVLSAAHSGLFAIEASPHFDLNHITGLYRASLLFLAGAIPYMLVRKPVLTQGMWQRFLLFGGGILFLSAWYALLTARAYGVPFLLSLMSIVWLADSGAYFAGKWLGVHKLAPSISPGKTWEGVAGGMAFALLVAAVVLAIPVSPLVTPTIFHVYAAHFGVFGTFAFVILWVGVSVVGDLFESLLKRQAGVKDSGKILPGHGGMLDRIDGLLFVLPLAMFFVPV